MVNRKPLHKRQFSWNWVGGGYLVAVTRSMWLLWGLCGCYGVYVRLFFTKIAWHGSYRTGFSEDMTMTWRVKSQSLTPSKRMSHPSVLLAGVMVFETVLDCLDLGAAMTSPSFCRVSKKASVLFEDLPSFMALPVADGLLKKKRREKKKDNYFEKINMKMRTKWNHSQLCLSRIPWD